MIWLFDRNGEQLKYEICRQDNGDGFLLVMTQADGQKKVEHVDQPSELIEKSVDQMKQLREDGWKIG
ncbi:MAG TPA: hypothetical protein VL243_15740 [Vicinamibacterales bacterium]|jgi:hypothetical protein|nr:hypothetical protein [Vicinamibacterales bacterium]